MVGGLPSWFGRMLRGMRAGIDKTLFSDVSLASVPASIIVESGAFTHGGSIPKDHSDDGAKSSPPLAWHGVPTTAVTVVLVIEDADSPTPSPFVHLVAWGLPGRDGELPAGAGNRPRGDSQELSLRLGRNGMFGLGYTPPDPPPGHGPHRYLFQVYALDQPLVFTSPPSRNRLARSLSGHVIAKGCIEGVYERL